MKPKEGQHYLDFGSPKQTRVVDPTDIPELPGQTTFDLTDTSITLCLPGDGTFITI